jgi:CRISPR-associated exonuclease Cas4
LAFAERLFRSEGPVPLVAKLDRAYRNAAGVLVLIELKTRVTSRAYGSEVIELSAQRLALAAQTGDVVSDYAYVLTQHPDGRRTGWHLVRLLAHADVVALEAPSLGSPIHLECAENVCLFGHVGRPGGESRRRDGLVLAVTLISF